MACLLSGVVLVAQPAETPAPPQPVAADAPGAAVMRDFVATATVTAPPAALRFANRDIVVFRATALSRTPEVRAAAAARLLESLAAQSSVGAVSARTLGGGEVISVGALDLFVLVPADLDLASPDTLTDAARATATKLQLALTEAREAQTPWLLVQSVAQALGATILLVVLLRLLLRGHHAFVARSTRAADRQLQRLPASEVVRATRLIDVVRYLVRAATTAVAFVLTYSWLAFVLRRFPYSRPWGEALRGFFLERLIAFGTSMLGAIPDLFSVLLIVLVTRFVVRLSGRAFDAVEHGRLNLPWVYPDTAQPTRRLVSAFLWLFALALSYPYLPGSNSDAFKGVSVFVGLMISLGSSGIVNQVMSGLTLTYSRALHVGDFVRIGEVEGTVTHMGSLSTKLKTPRREEITIPNAVVVSTQTTNYSSFADTEGVFAATEVTIGYDVAWRQVQALLLQAAARTAGVRSTPAPAVRQSALRDSYVEYTLLVCLDDPATRGPVLDRLHGHVQDAFNEHGIQIMSPVYEADPPDKKIVPRDKWFAEPETGDRPEVVQERSASPQFEARSGGVTIG